jgi:hypothetical protein
MHEASDLISNITDFLFLIAISYTDLDKDIICTVHNVRDIHYVTVKRIKKEN